MKWSSHCILLMSDILATQSHWLVTVPLQRLEVEALLDLPGCLRPTPALMAAGCQLTAESFPRLSSWPKRGDLAPGSIFSLWCHIQRPVNVEVQRPGPLASSLQSSEGSPQLRGLPVALTDADSDLGCRRIMFNLSLHQPFLPHSPFIPQSSCLPRSCPPSKPPAC